jgi:hypothetical protein
MQPKHFMGVMVFFLLCCLISGVIEKQDLIAEGSTEKTAIEKIFSFTQIDISDALGNPSTFLNIGKDMVDGIWTVFTADYAFTQPTATDSNFAGQIMQYLLWAINLGLLISFAITLGQMVRGAG